MRDANSGMIGGMRTTLTIDDHIAASLRKLAERQGAPLKTVVNAVLQAGINALATAPRRAPYRTPARDLGFCAGVDPYKLGQTTDADYARFPGLRWRNLLTEIAR